MKAEICIQNVKIKLYDGLDLDYVDVVEHQ